MSRNIVINPEVQHVIEMGKPVVALESTLISHGMPYPHNVQTALDMEALVREAGAIPATIAVLQGMITVGISADDIERIGTAGDVRKCSRRDLPIAVGFGEDAATTVAGTMVVAHMAGIHVFATGGIGGVHRGHPFDVSADLIEFGRTPVAVISSGAKSILDLPLTLEVLETQGVPVIGYGVNSLPAFYARESGLPVDACVDTPEQAAQIIAAAYKLGVTNGVLFGVPVPAEDEMNTEDAEKAITQATADAEAAGVTGKDVTPFVLGRVNELTGGASMRANTSLLRNNARVAGQVAVALTDAL